jgi:hypothetical protein
MHRAAAPRSASDYLPTTELLDGASLASLALDWWLALHLRYQLVDGEELHMIAALIVLLIILAILGGGGFAWNVLWYVLIAALILWALGFLLRGSGAGGRWYRW